MSISTLFEPQNARYTLPTLFLVGYAIYHYWRYRMLHPRIVIDELPTPPLEIFKPSDLIVEKAVKSTEATKLVAAQDKPAAAQSKKEERPSRSSIRGKKRTVVYTDEDLQRLFKKAQDDRPENYVRLGEFAWARGALVEAHFWLSLAKLNGVHGLSEWLGEIRRRWDMAGCPAERHNIYCIYIQSYNQIAFAYISLKSGFCVNINKNLIEKVAKIEDPCIAAIAADCSRRG